MPNLGLRPKLGEYFTIYNLNEFKISCLNYKTEEIYENLYLPNKKRTITKNTCNSNVSNGK